MNELQKILKENRRGRVGSKGTIQMRSGTGVLNKSVSGLGTNKWKRKNISLAEYPYLLK